MCLHRMEKKRVYSGMEICEGVEIPPLLPMALGPFNARFAFSEYDPGAKFSEGHNMLVQSAPDMGGTVRGLLV